MKINILRSLQEVALAHGAAWTRPGFGRPGPHAHGPGWALASTDLNAGPPPAQLNLQGSYTVFITIIKAAAMRIGLFGAFWLKGFEL